MESENTLLTNRHILVLLDIKPINCSTTIKYLKDHFCGIVLTTLDNNLNLFSDNKLVYIGGNIQQNYELIKTLPHQTIFVIQEISTNYENHDHNHHNHHYTLTSLGKVPLNIHNTGVFFPQFFSDLNYFKLLTNEHEFQSLTESNKPGSALRKGIYLSKVDKMEKL